MVDSDAIFWLRQVFNPAHRQFLENKLREIEDAENSPADLNRIREEINDWNDREFPVDRKARLK
jgi:hypothetical protein